VQELQAQRVAGATKHRDARRSAAATPHRLRRGPQRIEPHQRVAEARRERRERAEIDRSRERDAVDRHREPAAVGAAVCAEPSCGALGGRHFVDAEHRAVGGRVPGEPRGHRRLDRHRDTVLDGGRGIEDARRAPGECERFDLASLGRGVGRHLPGLGGDAGAREQRLHHLGGTERAPQHHDGHGIPAK
jgi:hypothetical protein